jgi:O-antigen ligase
MVSGKGEAFLSLFLANKNVAVFTLLLPLGLYAAWKNGARSVAGVLGLIAAALFLKTDSQAAQCAMIVMILVGLGLMVCKRTVIDGAFMMAAFLLVIFPFVSQPMMEHLADPVSRYEKTVLGGATAAMRIENYSFISKRILEEPLSGHGIDTTRHMTFETDAIYFPDNKILHPHNVYLQIWLEFGAYGAAFFLGFLFFIWRAVRCSTGHAQYLRVTFFCMLMVFLSISWSMWASWLIGATVFGSAMVRMADTGVKDKQAC